MKRIYRQVSNSSQAKKRKVVKYVRPGRMLGVYNNPISKITRSGYLDINVVSGGTLFYGFGVNSSGFLYTLGSSSVVTNSWTGSTDISSLYDAYRIMGFKITVGYQINSSPISNTSQMLPFMYTSQDHDDISTVSGSVGDILQRQDVRQVVLGKTSRQEDFSQFVVPKLAPLAYATSTTSGYLEPKARQWVSTSSGLTGTFTDPQHYGIKLFIDSSDDSVSSVSKGRVRVFIKCYFEAKICK